MNEAIWQTKSDYFFFLHKLFVSPLDHFSGHRCWMVSQHVLGRQEEDVETLDKWLSFTGEHDICSVQSHHRDDSTYQPS